MNNLEMTSNGIPYDWYLAGPDGASFILYPQTRHDDKAIAEAKRELYRDRDVVSIRVDRNGPAE